MYEISTEQRSEQTSAVVRQRVGMNELDSVLASAFAEVGSVLAAQGLTPAGPPFGEYAFVEDGFDVAAGFPCSSTVMPAGRVEPLVLPGGSIASTLHIGAYDKISLAYQALADWLASSHFIPSGAPWEYYLDGPDAPEPRTLVCFPFESPNP